VRTLGRAARARVAPATAILAALASLTAAGTARAGNDDSILVGNRAAMVGGAVSATVADASSTWYNPAGLSEAREQHIDVSGTGYALRFYSVPRFLRGTQGEVDDANVTEFFTVPAQIAYARRLAPNLMLGLGYFVPEASDYVLREGITSGSDPQSRWQVSLAYTRFQHTGGAALGWELSRVVRMGVSLIGLYETEKTAASIVAVGTAAGTTNGMVFSSALATASRIGMEAGLGFQFLLDPRFRLALTARSPRLLIVDATDSATATGAAASGEAVNAELAQPTESSSTLRFVRAGRFGAGVTYYVRPETWIALEADVQPPIVTRSAGVERSEVVNARLGGFHRVSDGLGFGAGLFTDRSASKPSNEPLGSRGDFYGGTFGVELRNRFMLAPGSISDSLLLSTILSLRYAHSTGSFNSISVSPAAEIQGIVPSTLSVHELSLYFGGGVSF